MVSFTLAAQICIIIKYFTPGRDPLAISPYPP